MGGDYKYILNLFTWLGRRESVNNWRDLSGGVRVK